MLGRRAFLGGLGAATASLALGRPARAATAAPEDRRFLFVHATGGWDVTRVFAPLFGASGVAMEPDAAPATAGGIDYVDHPARPSVRAFFDAWHDRCAVVNGILLSSISHASATRLITTGTPDASVADWPTRLAAARADAFLVPAFVVGGPSFAGRHGVHVGRAGVASQLQGLCTGDILDRADVATGRASSTDGDRVDAWLAAATERAAARHAGATSRALTDDYALALERAATLRTLVGSVDLTGGATFGQQVDLAVRVLGAGLARCASVAYPDADRVTAWDSHAGNDGMQTLLFEGLFDSLAALMATLEATPGATGGSLADETVVVVLSEMGRTPTENGTGGRDHWPVTSALLLGAGVRGDRVVGGYDGALQAWDVDPDSGDPVTSGTTLVPNVLGATLLALGGVDPVSEGLVDPPVTALIA